MNRYTEKSVFLAQEEWSIDINTERIRQLKVLDRVKIFNFVLHISSLSSLVPFQICAILEKMDRDMVIHKSAFFIFGDRND
jgi:hypothetical protein